MLLFIDYNAQPKTPEQNGLVECQHRHIMETSLTLLRHAYIPTKFWTPVFNTIAF